MEQDKIGEKEYRAHVDYNTALVLCSFLYILTDRTHLLETPI